MNLLRYVAPLGAVLLAACSTFSVSNQWKDPSWPGPPAGNVLVMGITKSDTYRHVFEDTFAQQLQAAGVQAEQLLPDPRRSSLGKTDRRDQGHRCTGNPYDARAAR